MGLSTPIADCANACHVPRRSCTLLDVCAFFLYDRVMATMNPGGDFGKRELSPALRSRFTEVSIHALWFGAGLKCVQ